MLFSRLKYIENFVVTRLTFVDTLVVHSYGYHSIRNNLTFVTNKCTSLACSGHTSATTWNSAKSEGTASDEYA